ncbi:hypothetical protein HNY73_007381 [Argiope bruennichi]|uniref:DUF5641 domain-containing protein n=1 Tax=Argiope bruennichi TaxID=94029 RepID=A0A8T0FKS9_ARGBR|nr:hypothetical protein HNY73_007381 [Argiope bruennichi]
MSVRRNVKPLSVNDMVLLESDLKLAQWALARIVELFPGKDEHHRVAKVKIQSGELIRPVHRLYNLEVLPLNQLFVPEVIGRSLHPKDCLIDSIRLSFLDYFSVYISNAEFKDLDMRAANRYRKRLRIRAQVIEELRQQFRSEYLGQMIQTKTKSSVIKYSRRRYRLNWGRCEKASSMPVNSSNRTDSGKKWIGEKCKIKDSVLYSNSSNPTCISTRG